MFCFRLPSCYERSSASQTVVNVTCRLVKLYVPLVGLKAPEKTVHWRTLIGRFGGTSRKSPLYEGGILRRFQQLKTSAAICSRLAATTGTSYHGPHQGVVSAMFSSKLAFTEKQASPLHCFGEAEQLFVSSWTLMKTFPSSVSLWDTRGKGWNCSSLAYQR